ncbi:MAG: metallophosphoesterase family protein [Polyangiaceae bacterium]|nr:metallophosphoesterase family protein [Polyangiaceae bacterium]
MTVLTGKIGLIGDVHQEDRYLERTLQRLRDLGVEAVLCTGDIVDGEGSADYCFDLLDEAGVHAVRGNHDRWILRGAMRDLPHALPTGNLNGRSRKWLETLPPSVRFTTPLGTLLLCHGLGDDDMATLKPDDEGYALEVNDRLHALVRDPNVDIVVAGHTHCRMVRHFDGLTVVNAGTLLRHHEPGFAVLDLDAAEVVFYAFGAAGIVEVERYPLKRGS